MSFQATCPACDKRFRVPHDDKQWRCKLCDGVLTLAPEGRPADPAATLDCPECGVANAPSASACTDCGAGLAPADRRSERERKKQDKAVMVKAKSAQRALKNLRLFLLTILFIRLLSLSAAILAVLGAEASPLASAFSEDMFLVVGRGFEVTLLILILTQLDQRPYPAALTLAVFSTIVTALALSVIGSTGAGFAIDVALMGIFPVLYWSITARARTLTQLRRDHPELVELVARKGVLRERPEREGQTTAKSAKRAKARTGPPIALFICMAVVVLGVVGVVVKGLMNRPTSPAEVVAELGVAWNAKDFEGMAQYVAPGSRERWIRNLERVPKVYDWGDDWPRMSESAFRVEDEVVRVEFDTEAGVLPFKLRWSDDEGWELYSMTFAQVRKWKQ